MKGEMLGNERVLSRVLLFVCCLCWTSASFAAEMNLDAFLLAVRRTAGLETSRSALKPHTMLCIRRLAASVRVFAGRRPTTPTTRSIACLPVRGRVPPFRRDRRLLGPGETAPAAVQRAPGRSSRTCQQHCRIRREPVLALFYSAREQCPPEGDPRPEARGPAHNGGEVQAAAHPQARRGEGAGQG